MFFFTEGNRFLKYLLHQVEGTITENPNIEETLRYNISHQLERVSKHVYLNYSISNLTKTPF